MYSKFNKLPTFQNVEAKSVDLFDRNMCYGKPL